MLSVIVNNFFKMNKYDQINGIEDFIVNDSDNFVKDSVSDKLYSDIHHVQSGNKTNSQQSVRLTIINLTARNTFLKKILKVKITDENNPFFMYLLELNDEDYGHLKMTQGLLIDFCHFPNELVSLLEKCKNQQKDNESTRFFITFEENSTNHNIKDEFVLKIMESNCFKVLCHLALTLIPASIGDVKKEVLANISHLKDTNCRHESNQRELERKIQELIKNIDKKNRENEELRNHWDEQHKNWEISRLKQINEIQEDYIKKHKDAQLEMKLKEEEIQLVHCRVVEQLKESLETLKMENTHLTKSNLDLDLLVQNQASKINNMEAKINILEDNLQTSKYSLQEKLKDMEMKETTIKTLKTRLSNTDKNLIESTKKQSALARVVEELTKEKNKLSNVLKLKEQAVLNNNDHLKTVCGDLVKANSIIRQLQRENNICRLKLDKVLQYFQEQTTKLVKCSEQLHTMKEASEAKEKELDYLQKTAMSTDNTLKELKKDILSTKQLTKLHDKEIMDLKRQPIVRDYKINSQIRKQCLENIYLSRPIALIESQDDIKNGRTSGENITDGAQNNDVNSQSKKSPSVLNTFSEPVIEVIPSRTTTQPQWKRPNIPVIDISDETKLEDDVSKPKPLSANEKTSTKCTSIGLQRATSNKITDYKVGSYFQKAKPKKS